MRRPLTNAEQVYRTVYLDLCAMCCIVLNEAENGDYLRFSLETVETANIILAMDPQNETSLETLRAAQELLTNAELDAKDAMAALPVLLSQYKQTEAEAAEPAAELAAESAIELASEPAVPEIQLSAVSASLSPGSSVVGTPLMQGNTVLIQVAQEDDMFNPLSSPPPGEQQESEEGTGDDQE